MPSRKTKTEQSASPARDSPQSARRQDESLFPVVGIGASAGGLEAFNDLLHALAPDTGMALVLIQHMDPSHGSMLSEILSRATVLPVSEIRSGTRMMPDHVYVAPPGVDVGITDGTLILHPHEPTRAPHRSIDYFLRALAADRHHRAIGVILSGSSSDGTLGLEESRRRAASRSPRTRAPSTTACRAAP